MSILFIKLSLLEGKYAFKIFCLAHTLMHQNTENTTYDIKYSCVLRGQKSFLSTDVVRHGSKCIQGIERAS